MAVPLNVTVLLPLVEPKAEPLMVTNALGPPELGEIPLMRGVTVKVTLLLVRPPTVTTTGPAPAVAPVGTGATMLVVLQLVGVGTGVPLKVTVPGVAVKFNPVMVAAVPTAPEVGERLLMLGATLKVTPLLANPPTVTTTAPVVAPDGTGATMLVALQLLGVAAVPLKVTVLVPCVAPKVAPLIVTEVPTGPEVGDRVLMLGATLKVTPLLANPPTVTTTGPVVAPVGTGATMLVALQLVGVAVVPLKVTVLVPRVPPKCDPLMVTEVPTGPEVGERLLMLGAALHALTANAEVRAKQMRILQVSRAMVRTSTARTCTPQRLNIHKRA